MDRVFIRKASDIIGETNTGLSGSKIVEYLSDYAYKYNVNIPYPTVDSMKEKCCKNKRTALYENLSSFNEEQQYLILKNLCELPIFGENNDVKELKTKLILQYGDKYYNQKQEIVENSKVISEHWLKEYSQVYEIYNEAMVKYNNNIFDRNLLDDLRLSLELLLKVILKNEKSLENQNNELSKFLNEKQNTQIFINFFNTILNAYTTYQNNIVKHIKNFKKLNKTEKEELDFFVELTNNIMKFLIENNKK